MSDIRSLLDIVEQLNEAALPTQITPTHYHENNFGWKQPLMLWQDGKFYWKGSSGKIERWFGDVNNRSALGAASVDGIYKDGKPIPYPEGYTFAAAQDKPELRVDPIKVDPNAPKQIAGEWWVAPGVTSAQSQNIANYKNKTPFVDVPQKDGTIKRYYAKEEHVGELKNRYPNTTVMAAGSESNPRPYQADTTVDPNANVTPFGGKKDPAKSTWDGSAPVAPEKEGPAAAPKKEPAAAPSVSDPAIAAKITRLKALLTKAGVAL